MMRAKTTIYCFGLLSALALVGLASEAVVATLAKTKPPSVYQIIPVTSLPLLVKHFETERTDKSSAPARQKSISEKEQAARLIETATLYLKNGSKVSGPIISEEGGWITLRIDGSEVGFYGSEINRIERSKTTGT